MNRHDNLLRTDAYGVTVDETAIGHLTLSAAEAVAADGDAFIDGKVLTTAVQTVTTFLNPMPYPRNVSAVASAAAATKITVNGTNIDSEPISEELTLNGTTPVLGALAFKKITSIVLPIKTGSENVDVGFGQILGLPFMLNKNTVFRAMHDGTTETTAPTVVVDADEIEKNTIELDTDLNGKEVDIYILL